ncbi:MAG: alpha-L-rhamnosidase, partial [Armatimonadota bacterium]
MKWKGAWIWAEAEESPRNAYLYARKTFDITTDVEKAKLRVTADSRYRLWINGIFINNGPVPSDPRYQSYDEIDIRKSLQRGANVVAVLAHHYG